MKTKLQDLDFKIIQSLLETPGLPGRESLIADLIIDALPKEGWTIKLDAIGNLTAKKPGNGKKILFISHMDEVGLIVRKITLQGFLQVERLGGIGVHVLPGTPLDLWTDKSRFNALIGAEPAHLVSGHSSELHIENLFVDIGVSSKEEAISLGVNVGDGLTWQSPMCFLAGNRIRSKALDNRLGCFSLIKMAEMLNDFKLDYEVTMAFVTQEESMILGSAPVVHTGNPDVVIGVDGTLPFDTPSVNEPQSDVCLGKGPCIKLMDAIRGKTAYLPSRDLTMSIIKFLELENLPYQREVIVGLSTALSLVPFMNNGIRTACFSLPIRYHHTAVEVADMHDLEKLIDSLMGILLNRVFE